jgi:hypothetical protein
MEQLLTTGRTKGYGAHVCAVNYSAVGKGLRDNDMEACDLGSGHAGAVGGADIHDRELGKVCDGGDSSLRD